MRYRIPLVFGLLLLLGLAACSPPPTNNPTEIESPENEVTPSAPATEPDVETPEEESGALTLRIWLPPQFSPDPANEAGALLKARLDEFVLLHPGVRVTVRIKAESGAGGMYNSLAATSEAVPEALPDLVLAPRLELERAAAADLLGYFEDAGTGWYDFTTALAISEGNLIGLPFAGDALILLYRPESIAEPPIDWNAALALDTPLIFAVGDPRALFTLAQYQAVGGEFETNDGQVIIDPIQMADVFKFYREALEQEIFPSWTTAVSSQTEVHQSLLSGRTQLGVVWASSYFADPDPSLGAAVPPTSGGVPFTLATGWLWALGDPQSRHQSLNIELANFLTEPGFMAEWTYAAGYLPMRPEALANWPESVSADLAGQIAVSAAPIPSLTIIETSGPLIKQALIDLWSGDISLMDAAESVSP